MKPFIDFLGNTVNEGDFVIYSTGASRSSSTQSFGVVEKIEYVEFRNKHKITVAVIDDIEKYNPKKGEYENLGWKIKKRYGVRTPENLVKYPISAISNKDIRAIANKKNIELSINEEVI